MPRPRKYPSSAQRQRAYRRRLENGLVSQFHKDLPGASGVPAIPSSARWRAIRRGAQELLAALQGEMDRYHSGRSERWQESERGEEFQNDLELLAQALESLESMNA